MALLFERVFLFIMDKLKNANAVLVEQFLENRGIEVDPTALDKWCPIEVLYTEFLVSNVVDGNIGRVKLGEFKLYLKMFGFKIIRSNVCFRADDDSGVFRCIPEFKGCRDSDKDIRVRNGMKAICDAIMFMEGLDVTDSKVISRMQDKFWGKYCEYAKIEDKLIQDTSIASTDDGKVRLFLEENGYDINGCNLVKSSTLYSKYLAWQSDKIPLTIHRFGISMGEIGVDKKRLCDGNHYFL